MGRLIQDWPFPPSHFIRRFHSIVYCGKTSTSRCVVTPAVTSFTESSRNERRQAVQVQTNFGFQLNIPVGERPKSVSNTG